jgi:glycosyltransferase involved in cell wall biosynthesis
MRVGIDEGAIFFDITKLIVRVGYKTPTGISRVEMAYALELLRRYPERIRFIVALNEMVQIVPNAVARRFLTVIERRWRDQQTHQSQAVVRNAAEFLDIAPSRLLSESQKRANNSDKYLLAATLLISGMINTLSPRGLRFFSGSPKQNVYIHVSGSKVPSAWIERWLARSPSVSAVFLVHDVIPLTHPEYFKAKVPINHASYVRRTMRTADVVIANSAFTADALEALAGEKGLPVPRIVVAPLGVSDVFARKAPPEDAITPYFIFVSTIEPRKNHMMILRVWARIIGKIGDKAPKLIIVGRRGWENDDVIDVLERVYKSSSHILECNHLGDETLAALMANARATLMPSHVEGYGLPVAEALSMGTPVICSDLPPFREVAGDVPEYVDPRAGRSWARIILDYAQPSSPARQAQLKRIQTYRQPSWQEHFNKVAAVIDDLAAGQTDA